MKRSINETDLQRLAKDGVVEVTRDMVLTPSAREAAARDGLRLRYVEGRSRAQSPMDGESLGRLIEEVVVQELSRARPPEPGSAAGPAVSPPTLADSVDAASRAEIMDASCDGPESARGRAVIAAIGRNRPGIVARISAAVADAGGDLADMSQVIVDQYFSLIFLVNLEGIEARGLSFRVFRERLKDEASR
ncbi:MAG: hypothetical protein FJ098_15510, partial [Deltaproteobacteria bacterium]|nr:hypothetical protein [Deltaproteobacteria bacterium]